MYTVHSSISCNDNLKDVTLLLHIRFRVSKTWPCFSSARTEQNYAFSSHISKVMKVGPGEEGEYPRW